MEARQEGRLKEHFGSRPECTGRKHRFAEPTICIINFGMRNVQGRWVICELFAYSGGGASAQR
jgi:hypothetical protein